MEMWTVIAIILSVLTFLFQIFNTLRRDYDEREVVKVSLLGVLIVGCLGYFASFHSLGFLSVLLGIFVIVFYSSRKYSWRFFTTLELIISPGLKSLLIFLLLSLVIDFNWRVLAEALAVILTMLSNFHWRGYRRFSWYPSGKAGFLFISEMTTLFILKLFIDFWQKRLIELTVLLILIFLNLVWLYLLSGKKRTKVAEVKI